MPDPATSTYLGLPGFALLWVAALVAFGLFGRRALHYVRLFLRARGEARGDHLGRRFGLFAANVLGQRRLLDESLIGVVHFFIFWAFVFYAVSFFWTLVRGLVPALPVPYADEVLWMAAPLEWLGLVALAGVGVAAVRRAFFPPPRLERSRDAAVILTLIGLLLLSFLAGQGMKAVAEGAPVWLPASWLLGVLFAAAGVREQSAPSLFLWTWWVHMGTVLGFLAYLPYSKHLHLLASPFGVFFGATARGSVPPSSEGAGTLRDLTWRQLLNGLACAECGRCDRVCPAFTSGSALSPKELIHHIRELVRAPLAASNPTGPVLVSTNGEGAPGVIAAAAVWSCAACYACMERCPVLNEHVHLIMELRRHLVAQGAVDDRLQAALTNLSRYGNSQGQPARARTRWMQGLPAPVKDARKEPAEYLWFVGDYASYDPRVQPMTRAAARIFRRAGVDVAILHEEERNSGNDARRAGEEGLFDLLREKNVEALRKANVRKIVTTDPHTYHALRNEYGPLNGNGRGPQTLHAVELLDDLLRTSRLPVQRRLNLVATYHDPCYLGRANGIYAAPRRVLRALGVTLREMPRHGPQSYCCGAGGGRIWMEESAGIIERPAESRVREAAALPGVTALVVACPKDYVMFQDALKTTGLESRLVIKDVLELVEEATAPEGEG